MYLSSVSSRLLLYDTNSWDLKKSYGCYDGILRDISWSDDSKYILQVDSKGLVDILSPVEHDIRRLQHIPIKDTCSASFQRDGHQDVAIGTRSGNVLIWDTKNRNINKTFPTPSQPSSVNFISFNAKNTSLAATLFNGDTVIYGLLSNIPVMNVKLSCSKSISAMKFHHESRSLLGLATDEGHIVLRDITSNKDRNYFENIHASPVSDIAFSLINKDVMLSSGYDKIMNVYDTRMQNVVSTIRTSYTLTSLTINLENQVALGTKNGHVLIYDPRDLTYPFKILRGHEEEVRKVAYQPIRKKTVSANISFSEDVELSSPHKKQSPVRSRISDAFFINNTPPKNNLDMSGQVLENKEDSFLVMMGLDKSYADYDDEANKSADYERKNDKHEIRYRQLDAEKNISKISTSLTGRIVDNLNFPPPLLSSSNVNDPYVKQLNINVNAGNLDTKTVEELKDFFKLTLSYVADDNRNYFLHVIMALTKQKLFFEKQISNMNDQIHNLIQNQSILMETNIKLAILIDQLKAQHSLY